MRAILPRSPFPGYVLHSGLGKPVKAAISSSPNLRDSLPEVVHSEESLSSWEEAWIDIGGEG